jgi:hypothetical protein
MGPDRIPDTSMKIPNQGFLTISTISGLHDLYGTSAE